MKRVVIAFLLLFAAGHDDLTAQSVSSGVWQSPKKSPGVALQSGLSGMWWRDQVRARSLGLTPDQQKKMDGIFQQSRIKLIDLHAALEKEEAILEPLLEAERADEGKVFSQLDRVADARAELEKANTRMLFSIRQALTPEQWSKLQSGKLKTFNSNFRLF